MITQSIKYLGAFFQSVSHVLQAEQVLKEAGVPHKIIPIPRKISTDCGICIRFLPEYREFLENTLADKVERYKICGV